MNVAWLAYFAGFLNIENYSHAVLLHHTDKYRLQSQ